MLASAEIVVGHIWRGGFPPAPQTFAGRRSLARVFVEHDIREETLAGIDRRTALGVGLGVVTALIADPRRTALAAIGDETKLAEGVVAKTLGEGPSIIPGFPKVRLREVTMQPGSSFPLTPMMNSMICHTLQVRWKSTTAARNSLRKRIMSGLARRACPKERQTKEAPSLSCVFQTCSKPKFYARAATRIFEGIASRENAY